MKASEINRRLTSQEFDEARRAAVALGLSLDERRPHTGTAAACPAAGVTLEMTESRHD